MLEVKMKKKVLKIIHWRDKWGEREKKGEFIKGSVKNIYNDNKNSS